MSTDETSFAKVQIINENEDKTSLTAVIQNEDHTLGNSLRYILMRWYVCALPQV